MTFSHIIGFVTCVAIIVETVIAVLEYLKNRKS